jgi:spore maturation protein SpmA
MLNWIWAAFFLIAFVVALIGTTTGTKPDALKDVVAALFDSSKTGFEIAIGLTGVMSLWLGLMKIAERGGVTEAIASGVGPLFRRLFPGVPPQHPAIGAIVMNRSANMLGLDNAATPLGLKAMKELQSLNPEPDRATNEMVLFVVMNASSVTLVPISILTFRAQLGAANPADVFVPILIATYIADVCGLLIVASIQKINLWNRVVIGWLGGLTLAVAGLVWHFSRLDPAAVAQQSAMLANIILLGLITLFRSTRCSSRARRKASRWRSGSSPTWSRSWSRWARCARAARSRRCSTPSAPVSRN